MTRRSLSPMQKLRIFEATAGRCHLCGLKIQRRWEVEHIVPLALGGADDETNMAPAHVDCHAGKSAKDRGDIARAKRRKAKHVGAFKSSRPMDGSRASRLKKHMDGRVTVR